MKQPENIKQAGLHKGPGHIDYRETDDITREHAAIQRENPIFLPGGVPLPMWLLIASGIAIFWAGAYLGMYNGGFSTSGFDEISKGQRGPVPGMKTATSTASTATPAEKGKRLFAQNCAQCHQATGLGMPGQYPPLAKSEYVNGGSKRLVAILLKGLQGPVKVEGAQFNGSMPAWGGTLTDEKIANIATYIRSDWGNSAPEIAPDQVAAARKDPKIASRTDPWSEADLQGIPADEQLPGGGGGAGAGGAAGGGGEQKK